MFYSLNRKQIFISECIWSIKRLSSAINIDKLWTRTKLKFHITKLKNCKIIDSVLFKKDLLWIFKNMHTKLLQEVHDQSSIFHLNNKWIIDLVQRFYYWSDHRATIQWYIRNYHACQRSKVFRNSINELHHSLSISQKRWKNIAMNFITELSLSEDYLLFPIVRWAYDALNSLRRRSPWHVDSSYASRSIRHIGRIPTRRSRARYFLWHES